MPEASELEAVMRYHERSKHRFNRFAPGPGELDWANQPDPFRRYAGAVPGAPVNLRTLSRLLEYALARSAWTQAGGTRWALRVNPSSGNLHPTEGWVLVGGIAEPGEVPGLFHCAPAEHGLERRIVQGGFEVQPCIHGQFPGNRVCRAAPECRGLDQGG